MNQRAIRLLTTSIKADRLKETLLWKTTIHVSTCHSIDETADKSTCASALKGSP